MKKFLAPLLLASLSLLLFGCPVGTEYALDKPGKNKIDKALIGTWVTDDGDATVLEVRIQKGDENSYQVEVLEKGESYMVESDQFTGWVTELGGEKFVFFQPQDSKLYFVYRYTTEANGIAIWDVSLLVGGMDAVTSTEAYQEEVLASMKNPDCFKESTSYHRQ